MSAIDENPFDLQKASNYSNEEILGHWVDLAGQHGGLVSVLKPASITPMILLGGKGSGKTHLMRYCSAQVQTARFKGNLLDAVRQEKYLGIYVTAEALNTPKFSGKGQDQETWDAIFSMYFEIWLCLSLLEVVRDAVPEQFIRQLTPNESRVLSNLFFKDVVLQSVQEYYAYLFEWRRRIDYSVSNSAFTRKIDDIEILFANGSLVFGMPDLVANIFPDLSDCTFVYLVDELENFTENQQRYLNTLIRYRKGKATIKLGARLYGIKTYGTLGAGESIRVGSEFERVELDRFLRDHEVEYNHFAIELVKTRLKKWSGRDVDTEVLRNSFASVDVKNHYKDFTLKMMERYDRVQTQRPHLKNFSRKLREAGIQEDIITSTCDALQCAEHPLYEKANLFIFIRSWDGRIESIERLTESIRDACEQSLLGRKPKSYEQTLSHYSSDLLAQLCREARQQLPYSGLETLIELSEGIPRNLLGTLSLIYRSAKFSGEKPFLGGTISVESQSSGVTDAAKFFWNDAQPEEEAPVVRDAIEALALLFRSIRFSDAPSECDLCAFSVNVERLSEDARSVLRVAENWSHILEIPGGSKNKNNQAIDAKYQLAPMLAPLWGVSHHRRGTIELQPDLANAIFDPGRKDDLLRLVQNRVSGMDAIRIWKREVLQRPLI